MDFGTRVLANPLQRAQQHAWIALVAACAALGLGGCATVSSVQSVEAVPERASASEETRHESNGSAARGDAVSAEIPARPVRQRSGERTPRGTSPNVRGVAVPVHVVDRRPQVREVPRGRALARPLEVARPGPAGARKPGSRGIGYEAAGISAAALAGAPPEPAAPPVEGSFDSTTFDDNAVNTGAFFIPADSVSAAGPDSLVNAVNVTIRFHGKDGSLQATDEMPLAGDAVTSGFFDALAPDSDLFDPKMLYDQYAERFVVLALDYCDSPPTCAVGNKGSRILVAVSDDSTPQGTWYQAAIDAKLQISTTGPATDHWVDFPGLAIDEEAVYITGNMFDFSSGAFGGVRLWVIDKFGGSGGGLYEGGTATVSSALDPYTCVDCIATTTQPAHVFGDPSNVYGASPNVGTFLVSYSGLSSDCVEAPCTLCVGGDGPEFVQLVRVDDPLATPAFTHQFVNVTSLEILPFCAELPSAPQDGAPDVDTNDRSVLNAVWRDGSLYFAATIDPRSGPDAGEATAHWWQLDVSNLSSISVADQGDVSGDGDIATDSATFFPSIAVNSASEMALGFSASASAINPGSYYTTRKPDDAPSTTSGEETLRAGLDGYERTFGRARNRWGDYSSVAVDPATQCFWVYNKHALCIDGSGGDVAPCPAETASENGRWGTAYGRVCIDCEASPLSITDWTGGTDRRASEITVEGTADILAVTDPVELEGQMIAFANGFAVDTGGELAVYTGFCPLP